MATSAKTTAPILEPLEVEVQTTPAVRLSLWRFCAVLAVCALCGAGAWHLTSSNHDTVALPQLYAYVPGMPMQHTMKSPVSGPQRPYLRNPAPPVAQMPAWGQRMQELANDCEAGIDPACEVLAEEEAMQGPGAPQGAMPGPGAPAWGPMGPSGSEDPGWMQHMQALAQDCQAGLMQACDVLAEEEANAGGMPRPARV